MNKNAEPRVSVETDRMPSRDRAYSALLDCMECMLEARKSKMRQIPANNYARIKGCTVDKADLI